MRFIRCLFIGIIMLSSLCSCVKGEKIFDLKISPSDKTLDDLVSMFYDYQQMIQIVQFNGSMEELNIQYPVECLRKTENMYRIAYCGDCSVAIMVFNKTGEKVFGYIYTALRNRSDFSILEKGQSVEAVKKIDPKGEYLFLYTGRNDVRRVSTHCTMDGYLISIEYDAKNKILSIQEDLI